MANRRDRRGRSGSPRDTKDKELRLSHENEPSETTRVVELPSLSEDQEEYLRELERASSNYDRNLLMGGPRNKR
jgi:hypothetical protein